MQGAWYPVAIDGAFLDQKFFLEQKREIQLNKGIWVKASTGQNFFRIGKF
jgi:hypothetical protein